MQHRTLVASMVCLGSIAVLAMSAIAADWPGFRGAEHNSTSPEKIADNWPADGPKILWHKPIGDGFGTVAVAGDKAFVMAAKDKREECVALNAATGEVIWSADIDDTIFERQGGPGPRSTPCIAGDKVYCFSTYFKLVCLNAADGKPVWTADLRKDYAAQTNTGGIKQWGNTASPIVVDDLVIVAGGGKPGETFLAFNRATGQPAWHAGTERVTHTTPVVATIGGVKQIVFLTQSGVIALEPAAGKELWRFAFPFATSTGASPVIDGDVIFVAGGYGVGGGAWRITKTADTFTPEKMWFEKGEKQIHWTTPLIHDGHIYGLMGFRAVNNAPLQCIDLKTGKELWSHDNVGQGGLILADNKLIVLSSQGALTLVAADPAAYKELGHIQAIEKAKCWNQPTLADGRVYARSTKEIACVEVAAESPK